MDGWRRDQGLQIREGDEVGDADVAAAQLLAWLQLQCRCHGLHFFGNNAMGLATRHGPKLPIGKAVLLTAERSGEFFLPILLPSRQSVLTFTSRWIQPWRGVCRQLHREFYFYLPICVLSVLLLTPSFQGAAMDRSTVGVAGPILKLDASK
jgi:hypothetical protein